MRRLITLILAAMLLAAAPASAAKHRFTIRGAGFGHGVGMSQYGAYGYALHGATYDAILHHYYTGTALGTTDTSATVRVLLQSSGAASFSGGVRAGSKKLSSGVTYQVRDYGLSQLALYRAGKRVGT